MPPFFPSYTPPPGTTVVGGEGGSTVTVAPINVVGADVGAYSSGTTIPAGTSFETILANMLRKRVYPTYTAPTLTMTGSGVVTQEVGTTFSPVLTPVWTKNDAGNLMSFSLTRNGTTVSSSLGNYTDTNVVMPAGTLSYVATVNYAEGATKNDNLGTPYPTGHITAGSVQATKTYTGVRKAFFGLSESYDTTAAIRTLPSSVLNPANGTILELTTISGQYLVFAYPATLRDATGLAMISGGNTYQVLTDAVYQANVTVLDASGANGIAYKVLTYSTAIPFTDATFRLTI